jgi:membrane protein YqaA with SNARE-associated domain
MPMNSKERLISTILAAIGGVVGGFVGYHAFFWVVNQGYYGMMIPGGLLGLGCGMLARHASHVRGAVAGLAGLGLGVFTEWKFAPFRADPGLVYMLTHIHELVPIHLIMIVLGGFFAYWLGKDGGMGRMVPVKTNAPTRDAS